jgi:hypothetical protein
MSRSTALRLAAEYFDSGRFQRDLQRRIALPTESQNAARADELAAYLREEIAPALAAMGFETQQIANRWKAHRHCCWRAASNRLTR